MKANPFYLTVAMLLVFSIGFLVLGSSSRGPIFADNNHELSYSLGLQLGRNLGARNLDINMTMFLNGLRAGRRGQTPLLTNKQLSQSTPTVMKVMGCQATESNSESQAEDKFMKNTLSRDSESQFQGVFAY